MVMPKVGERYYLITVDSKYCQNLQGEHSNNQIYFVITNTGLFQKCFCRCNTIEKRKFGKCMDYTSYATRIPPCIFSKLFPSSDYTRARIAKFKNSQSNKLIGMSNKEKVFAIINNSL
jgi:hypothetical protein